LGKRAGGEKIVAEKGRKKYTIQNKDASGAMPDEFGLWVLNFAL
jgi:hypothetical protein